MAPLKLLIVDDDPDFKRVLRFFLKSRRDCVVVADGGDGMEGVQLAREFQPDVVLMDYTMPVMNGIDATRMIKAERPATIVVLITVFRDALYRRHAEDAGAEFYVVKSDLKSELDDVLNAIAARRPEANA